MCVCIVVAGNIMVYDPCVAKKFQTQTQTQTRTQTQTQASILFIVQLFGSLEHSRLTVPQTRMYICV
jgi:hypothetical protein